MRKHRKVWQPLSGRVVVGARKQLLRHQASAALRQVDRREHRNACGYATKHDVRQIMRVTVKNMEAGRRQTYRSVLRRMLFDVRAAEAPASPIYDAALMAQLGDGAGKGKLRKKIPTNWTVKLPPGTVVIYGQSNWSKPK